MVYWLGTEVGGVGGDVGMAVRGIVIGLEQMVVVRVGR